MRRSVLLLFLLIYSSLAGQKVDLLPISTTGQIVKHKYYTLSYSQKNKQAEWVFYLLTKADSLGVVKRKNNFRSDPLISSGSASLVDYKNSGYDKGHLCPAADMSFDSQAMSETSKSASFWRLAAINTEPSSRATVSTGRLAISWLAP